MKKWAVLLSVLICVFFFAGCNNAQQEQAVTYSFHGENEYISVSNGTIILNGSEETLVGGNLRTVQADLFDNIVAYSSTFYTMQDGAQHTLMSSSVIDYTGGAIHVEEDLGRISGDGIMIGTEIENLEELTENLWFELKTTDTDGKEHIYQLKLTI